MFGMTGKYVAEGGNAIARAFDKLGSLLRQTCSRTASLKEPNDLHDLLPMCLLVSCSQQRIEYCLKSRGKSFQLGHRRFSKMRAAPESGAAQLTRPQPWWVIARYCVCLLLLIHQPRAKAAPLPRCQCFGPSCPWTMETQPRQREPSRACHFLAGQPSTRVLGL